MPIEWSIQVVAAVLCLEAGGEGVSGMSAVSEVIVQRMDERKQDAVKVVLDRHQFSCANGKTSSQLVREASKHPRWDQALQIAVWTIYGAKRTNLTKNANHYSRTDENPWWARGYKPVAKVGHHSFFKL